MCIYIHVIHVAFIHVASPAFCVRKTGVDTVATCYIGTSVHRSVIPIWTDNASSASSTAFFEGSCSSNFFVGRHCGKAFNEMVFIELDNFLRRDKFGSKFRRFHKFELYRVQHLIAHLPVTRACFGTVRFNNANIYIFWHTFVSHCSSAKRC